MNTSKLKYLFGTAMVACAGSLAAFAQSPISFYNSGSTGADGQFWPVVTPLGADYILTGVSIPGARAVLDGTVSSPVYCIDVPLRTNGLYNFTSITIPMNMRVRFIVDSHQLDNPPPVIFLATDDVVIAGEIGLTSKDTAGAYVGGRSYDAVNSENTDATGPRWIPGPGGYRGGNMKGDSGMGPSPGLYQYRNGEQENFCLPLVGGSGAPWRGDPSGYDLNPGCGGGGVIYLASSTRIIFDGNYGFTRQGIMFRSSAYNGNSGGYGMAALFANQIVGTPRSSDYYPRMLISACQQQVVSSGMCIYPMWSAGVIGNSVPTNPSVNIVMVGTNSVPATYSQTNAFPVSAPGQYPVTVQTWNLPANIVFNITAYQLSLNQSYGGTNAVYVTPPTASIGGGACSTTVNVRINSGYQLLTAKAKTAITVAMAPTFQGSPIDEWRWEMDRDGTTHTMYATASGAALSHEAVMRLALEQGKWDFIRAFGGQSIPKS